MSTRTWVEQIMGMPITIRVAGGLARTDDADVLAKLAFADLRRYDRIFSPYKPDSQVSRIQDGDLEIEDADLEVQQVWTLCETARERTGGRFDAWAFDPRGVWDPTGLVKSWAVARAFERFDSLDGHDVGINAGGDILVRTALPGSGGWTIGVEDPACGGRILATLSVIDGAVATSGIAARGLHIRDPRTGSAAKAVASATICHDSLIWADVWATAACVAGEDAFEFASALPDTAGLVVWVDGRVRAWEPTVLWRQTRRRS